MSQSSGRVKCTICKLPMLGIGEDDPRYWHHSTFLSKTFYYCPETLPQLETKMKLDHHYSSKYGIGDLVKLKVNGALVKISSIKFEMRGSTPTPIYQSYNDGHYDGYSEDDIKCRMVEEKTT